MAQAYLGTGRRKTSVARVRLVNGSGQFIINNKDLQEYFDFDTLRSTARSPLTLTEQAGNFDVFVNVYGGGTTGQADAIRHGVARALLEYDEDLRPTLKRERYLTRDSRKKERKKYGFKKARKSPQFSKR